MLNSYYILNNGQQEGPYSHHEITEMGINGHTLILSPLAADWQSASDLPEFVPYFEELGVFLPTASNLANFWWRLLAYLIDYVILVIVISIFGVVLVGVSGFTHSDFNITSDENDVALRLLFIIAFVVYNGIFEATELQGSIGKKICRLIVVDIDGQRCQFFKTLSRNAAKILSSLLCGLGFLNIFWDQHRQAWHDHLAKTYILRKPY